MYFKLLIKHALLKYLKLKPKLKKFLFFHLDRAIKYSANKKGTVNVIIW